MPLYKSCLTRPFVSYNQTDATVQELFDTALCLSVSTRPQDSVTAAYLFSVLTHDSRTHTIATRHLETLQAPATGQSTGMFAVLVGWLVAMLAGWSVGWLAGLLTGLLFGGLVGFMLFLTMIRSYRVSRPTGHQHFWVNPYFCFTTY